MSTYFQTFDKDWQNLSRCGCWGFTTSKIKSISWTQQNKNILKKKFNIWWTMISLNQTKVNGVLLVFLYQNRMEHIGCAKTTESSIIWVKQTIPILRMDDCIDKIGNTKCITKFGLLKGFRQIPLTERAKVISAFVISEGLYQYKVMPFGTKTFSSNISTLNQLHYSWTGTLCLWLWHSLDFSLTLFTSMMTPCTMISGITI